MFEGEKNRTFIKFYKNCKNAIIIKVESCGKKLVEWKQIFVCLEIH